MIFLTRSAYYWTTIPFHNITRTINELSLPLSTEVTTCFTQCPNNGVWKWRLWTYLCVFRTDHDITNNSQEDNLRLSELRLDCHTCMDSHSGKGSGGLRITCIAELQITREWPVPSFIMTHYRLIRFLTRVGSFRSSGIKDLIAQAKKKHNLAHLHATCQPKG